MLLIRLLALGASALASPMPAGSKNVDEASTRSDWVSSYDAGNEKAGSKNVDEASTRSDWVSSYDAGYAKAGSKNVDEASTRSDWVSSYDAGNEQAGSKNVDEASTRSDWVSSYDTGYKNFDDMELPHWIPSGPEYLKLDYSPVHHEHLITLASGTVMMHGDGLSGFMGAVARFLHV
ncbi:hypothetical protein BJ875DRAFT_500534 [Amylocarpus encephaloides]|uniref:Uncharacterized protein n=1 Tax=Amylocarpus encephaloides TaxID=45428 RepID=A0A9P7Y8P9_9HELO|nr:hypothetical protein BJ875DRAFT_500534 [Amylocarpus encephaloides]